MCEKQSGKRKEKVRFSKQNFRKPLFEETKNPQESAFVLCLQSCKLICMNMNKYMTARKSHECYQTYFKAQIEGMKQTCIIKKF